MAAAAGEKAKAPGLGAFAKAVNKAVDVAAAGRAGEELANS